MKKYRSPLDILKQEIDLRYNIVTYKNMYKKFLYQCFEKHNIEIIYDSLKELK